MRSRSATTAFDFVDEAERETARMSDRVDEVSEMQRVQQLP